MRSAYERETVIDFNEEEDEASVYTFNKKLIRKLLSLVNLKPDECKIDYRGPEDSISFVIPKNWIKINPPRTVNLTDEQKQERSERMKRIVQMRNGTAN